MTLVAPHGERAVAILNDLHPLAAKPRDLLFLGAQRALRVFGRRIVNLHTVREPRSLEVAGKITPSVALFIGALDVWRRAISRMEFRFKVLPFTGVELSGGPVSIDMDIPIRRGGRHGISQLPHESIIVMWTVDPGLVADTPP